jgi:type II restriction enzyme
MTEDIGRISKRLGSLSRGQILLLESAIDSFARPIDTYRLPTSDVVSDEFLIAFGDLLKLHHTFSVNYLDKHRFEAAMERIYNLIGRPASRPGMNNPGHDITVDGVAWSLKTQGDRAIRSGHLHISKFMELGKGRWASLRDLSGLRNKFLEHLTAYERIFQLRYFRIVASASVESNHLYELVEIPKPLLQEAAHGALRMVRSSKQNPKPGYCTVLDESGRVKYELYFDGGTERKLQIKKLRRDLCTVHATWKF